MGRIFIGLCQVGAWGCFDEFNRLEERMLSAVSQQIQTIQNTLKESKSKNDDEINLQLIGRKVKINKDMAIFITMNPGYAGRSNLPNNLKKLFRSFAMNVPDNELIAQVMLYSQGFKNAEKLSKKIVPLFKLCYEQLSQQSHYDFGLRALKTVLVSAGALKRDICQNTEFSDSSSNLNLYYENELQIISQSIYNTIIPKLVSDDCVLFNLLVSNVLTFNSSDLINNQYKNLKKHIFDICNEKHYLYKDEKLNDYNEWFNKLIQLNNILNVNHGIILVGESGTGKTSCWQVLFEALYRFDNIECIPHIIDPKAVTKDELYGILDPNTREWVDGLFTKCIRSIIDNMYGEMNKRHWIIFDGDIDPEWVENLNSTLDDNKILTLPNGERLYLPNNVRIIFEVTNLKYATLATVSRCGMIWFNENCVSTEMIFSNLKYNLGLNISDIDLDDFNYHEYECLKNQIFKILNVYFESNSFIYKLFDFSQHDLTHIMKYTKMRTITTFIGLLNQGIYNIFQYNIKNIDYNLSYDQMKQYISQYLLYSLIWALAGDCDFENKLKLSNFISQNVNINLPFYDNNNLSLFDYYISVDNCSWNKWSNCVTLIETTKDSNENKNSLNLLNNNLNFDIVVPTIDTLKNENLLISLLNSNIPIILCGPPGSGKTMTLMSSIKLIPNVEIVNLNFSCATTPDLILKTFEQYCEYRRTANGTVLSPVNLRKKLIVFCDEINLPNYDKYGTQNVITFLRQLISRNGFYRKKDYIWIELERIQFVAACNPPTDPGRKLLSTRFLRYVSVIYVDYPSYESMIQIYGTFIKSMNLNSFIENFNNIDITKSMIDLYFDTKNYFTTEKQPHYIYSPREITRWIRGIFEIIKNFNKKITLDCFVKIWVHEATRLFCDRLVYSEEKKWMNNKIKEISKNYFNNVNFDEIFNQPILFSKWLTDYYDCVNKIQIEEFLKLKLKLYCEEEHDLNLILYDELVDYALRLDRIFSQPQGHTLLIGTSGSGRTLLTKFVSWINNMSIFHVNVHKKYTIEHFNNDLKSVLIRAGCKNEKIVFILDESNFIDSSFVEKTNTLLANGEIPGLFDGDELNLLLSQVNDLAQQNGKILETSDDLYRYFTNNVVYNLHIVFTMNCSFDGLKNKAFASPALFNRCVINWFGDWSNDALYHVGNEILNKSCIFENNEFLNFYTCNSELTFKNKIVKTMVQIHRSIEDINNNIKQNGKLSFSISPSQFIDFLKHYIQMFSNKRQELEKDRIHLDNGLLKIQETIDNVEQMSKNLIEKRAELENKNQLANSKLKQMFSEQQEAENKRSETQSLQKILQEQSNIINNKQNSVIDELSKVEPAVLEAKKAVSFIKKQNLIELKSMSNPPVLVKMALESICVMLGNPTNDWKEIRSFIVKDDFISKILNFSTDNITESISNTMETKYLNRPDYNFEKVNRSSLACGPLVKWAIAQIYYSQMIKKVEPLRQELKLLETSLEKSTKNYEETKKTIQELEDSISKYKEEYAILVSDVQNIKTELIKIENRVERSKALITSLDSERSRWVISSESFCDNLKTLSGDILLCAAFVVYSGYFDQIERGILWKKWQQLLINSEIGFLNELTPCDYLTNPDEIMSWKSFGLPSDKLCLENVIMLKYFERFPLIIDPSGQAYEFLKRKIASKVVIASFLDDNFQKTLESCVRFGTTLIVMDVENYDSIINPILNMDTKKNGGRTLVRIGENELDLSPTFCLYLLTRDSLYEIPPYLASRTTIINFTVTPKSLSSQCLDMLLKSERPDVESKREDLGKMQGEFQCTLRQLERKLLDVLNQAEGSLLDDDRILETLECLKKQAEEISMKVSETDKIIKEVELTTSLYNPLSIACSSIYFTLQSLNSIHYYYQYSLNFFLNIYQVLLDKMKDLDKSLDYQQRLSKITDELFLLINDRVSKGLLQEHKIVLMLALCVIRIRMLPNPEIYEILFDYFIKDHTKINLKHLNNNKYDEFFDSNLQFNDYEMNELVGIEIKLNHIFTGFQKLIISNENEIISWKNSLFLPKHIPNIFNLSDEYLHCNKLIFGKLCQQLLVKVFRPDLLINSSFDFITTLFNNYNYSDDFYFDDIVLNQITCKTPILLCSIAGYDASFWVDDLVINHPLYNSNKHKDLLISVAMGSVEGYTLAENAINEAARTGSWVILKNIHLALKWVIKLEKKLSCLNYNKDFRLFLTCEINTNIPKNIICMSRVLIFEPPTGIKANLLRTFNKLSNERLTNDPIEKNRLYFLLSWLHAIIMERLKYTPIGWTKKYEFNESDIRIGFDIIDSWMEKISKGRKNISPHKIPWEAIKTIISKSIYGGRIVNEYDIRIMEELIEKIYTEKVFEENYNLLEMEDEIMKIPQCRLKEEYIEWIKNKIPDIEKPEWLGLSNNAEKMILIKKGEMIRKNLEKIIKNDIYERDRQNDMLEMNENDEINKKWEKNQMLKVQEWMNLLPKNLILLERNAKNLSDPIYRCYEREIRIGKELLDIIKGDIKEILDVCNGKIKKTNNIDQIMNQIQHDIIPDRWLKYCTLNLLTLNKYISELLLRLLQLEEISFIARNDSINKLIVNIINLLITTRLIKYGLGVYLNRKLIL